MTHPTEPQHAGEAAPALERARIDGHGDERVLTALYEEHRSEVLGFLIRMTHDREAAEDVLQDTFIRLIRESRAGRMPDDVRAWLYRVAANTAVSGMRRGLVWRRIVPRLLDRAEASRPEDEALRDERAREVDAALARLRPDARAALLLAAQGFDGREIAAAIGRTDAATRTMMCRARIELRQKLEPMGGRR